jgi:hypothetical protein
MAVSVERALARRGIMTERGAARTPAQSGAPRTPSLR